MAQQGTGQPPVAGECTQAHALKVIMDFLSSLVKTLSPHIKPVLAAPTPSILSGSPAVVSGFSVSPMSQPASPLIRSMQSGLPSANTGMSALDQRLPETYMKDVMPCEVSPLGYHLGMHM